MSARYFFLHNIFEGTEKLCRRYYAVYINIDFYYRQPKPRLIAYEQCTRRKLDYKSVCARLIVLCANGARYKMTSAPHFYVSN